MAHELAWMQYALNLAQNSGLDWPIASVIVYNNEILVSAHNEVELRGDPTAHSEMLCIQRACAKLNSRHLVGCVMYCTLEPCQMCQAALKLARVDKVIFGAFQNYNHNTKYDCIGGIMQQECSALLSLFETKSDLD